MKNGKFIEDYCYIGYLPSEDFVPKMTIALGLCYFNDNRLHDAEDIFTGVTGQYPGTQHEAEALYWLGVTKYKMTKDPSRLVEMWNIIFTKYPNSIWAKKVSFIKQ
ncbi:MAG: tetratricopeptide repeat protein [Planctomycetota bacterium]